MGATGIHMLMKIRAKGYLKPSEKRRSKATRARRRQKKATQRRAAYERRQEGR
jgi:hypothetical protein